MDGHGDLSNDEAGLTRTSLSTRSGRRSATPSERSPPMDSPSRYTDASLENFFFLALALKPGRGFSPASARLAVSSSRNVAIVSTRVPKSDLSVGGTCMTLRSKLRCRRSNWVDAAKPVPSRPGT